MFSESYKARGYFEIELKDKNGKNKALWQENFLYRLLKKVFGAYAPMIPFLTGHSVCGMVTVKNLIVTAGKAGMASRINGDGSEAAFTYLAVGIGTTAADAANTTLESEITDTGLERAAATCSRVTTTVTNDTAQLVKTWTATGAKAITEIGILNAASTGTLLARQVFSAVTTANGDQFAATYKVKAS